MQRDGSLFSVWQAGMPDYLSKNNDFPSHEFDVAIVGGGITGISTALQLQKAGKKCIVLEAFNMGFGTTGGTTAHINTFFDTPYATIVKDFSLQDAALAAKAAKSAIALIKRNISEYNIDCGFKELTGYIFSTNDKQTKELEDNVEACKKIGVKADLVNSTIIPIPYEKIALLSDQAQFHPMQYVYALAKAFEEAGGVIMLNCRVTKADENNTIEVHTSKGNIKCSQLVYATHIPPGVNLLHFRCAPYRSYVIAVQLNNNEYTDALVYDMHDPYHYYRTQEIDGIRYLIVGGEDHKTAHEDNTENCFRKLESYVRSFFDVKEVTYKWSSQWYEPNDGLAYIGNLPGHGDNVYVAAGFGGNGMIYGSFSAILLSELILNDKSEYAKLFDPNRIKPVAGFANFVKESADVIGKFIGGLFPKKDIEELSDIAKTEGRVVEYNGKKMGIYKDENGALYAVSTACTHIDCHVQFNTAEKSWDCPCHGARFSITGEVLTAPARKNLEVFNLQEEK